MNRRSFLKGLAVAGAASLPEAVAAAQRQEPVREVRVLSPCFWCGGSPAIQDEPPAVQCTACKMGRVEAPTRPEAVAEWNRLGVERCAAAAVGA
nr:twin-arginine translocation signal domain-containing protein [uncultured Rhodopila sp.]